MGTVVALFFSGNVGNKIGLSVGNGETWLNGTRAS